MKCIDEWEILTDDGWSNFDAVVKYPAKKIIKVILDNGIFIRGSHEHKIMSADGNFKCLNELNIGDIVVTNDGELKVIDIFNDGNEEVYDLVGVDKNNRYYINDILSHNCDELAFVPPRIQEELMASIIPALSSARGKIMITSTPNGNKDLFSNLWYGTGMAWDTEEMTYNRLNVPKNDFEPLFVPFWIDEEKNNDEWIKKQKSSLDIVKWKVEFECIDGDTYVNVYDTLTNTYMDISIENLYNKIINE